jgi:hypothetical protein
MSQVTATNPEGKPESENLDYHDQNNSAKEVAQQLTPFPGESDTPPAGDPAESKPRDMFSRENMRLNQERLKGSAKKMITGYVVRKPRKGAYFRVRPGEDYEYRTYVYVDKDEGGMDREVYLVDSLLSDSLDDEFTSVMSGVTLHLALERHAERPFVWRVGTPLNGEKDNAYWESAREIADLAKTQWVRMVTIPGGYGHYLPSSKVSIPEPIWPEIPFGEILRLAFKNRVIDSMDHPIMRNLIHGE